MTKPQLIPSVAETVRCVRDSLSEVIMPELESQRLRSSMASTIHLLQYIEERVENEGQLLYDEIKYLRGLFAEILSFAKGHPEAASLAANIQRTLDAKRDPDVYPSLNLIEQDVGEMRQHVCDAINLVLRADGPEAEALKASLNEYTSWQILAEEKMLQASFRGRGPRR